MVTGFFQRVSDWITFWASVTATTIGVMTISEKIALAGLLLGSLSAIHAWCHRRRTEQAMKRRNDLIARILARLRIFMKGDHSITPCVSIVVASIF
ncbi:phage tail protein [Escherichia coli]|uniref:phage tail protein n=2 Tax=Escherichia coli TaxID=562 RepID=UPI0020777C4D|nr:phage tail protein [Escherichia coli]